MSAVENRLILDSIQEAEGGYWDDPVGGPTNFGITQTTLDSIRGSSESKRDSLPTRVEDLQKSEARLILDEYYLVKNRVAELPFALALVVGHGVVMAWDDIIRIMQRELNVLDDGIIGSRTLRAAHALTAFERLGVVYRVVLQFVESRANGYKDSYATRFNKLVFLI